MRVTEFSPDGKLFAVVVRRSNSSRLDIWDVAAKRRLSKTQFDDLVTDVALLPRNGVVVVSNGIRLVDGKTGRIVKRLASAPQPGPTIDSKIFTPTPDGKSVVLVSRDYPKNSEEEVKDFVEVRDAKTWKLRQKIKIDSPRGAFIGTIAFSPTGKRAVTGAWDMGNGIQAYNLQSGRKLWTSNGHQEGNIVWSPDEKIIASSVTNGIYLLKPRNGRLLRRINADYGTQIRFSADGGRLMFLKKKDPIAYDLRSGKETKIAALPVTGDGYIDGVLSEDGRLLAQLSEDGSQVTFKSLNW